jgi:hypothetical protein
MKETFDQNNYNVENEPVAKFERYCHFCNLAGVVFISLVEEMK